MSDKFDSAKVRLADGRIAYDAVALAAIPTEGVFLKDCQNHVILVRTKNTNYRFVCTNGKVLGLATKDNGSVPKYLAEETEVNIHGSTWGGSMLKMEYIGVEMYLEFHYEAHPHRITTSEIVNVRVAPIISCDAPAGAPGAPGAGGNEVGPIGPAEAA